ncbi:MAG TPA: hypothetical protein VJU16_05800, partial [Planctomycetota bacterium]|nr:hypothetical protein [Planctomycetota bacterium]
APNDGEALYRKMEAALAGAKKLEVEFKSTTKGATIQGTFKVDEGNKLEMKVQGTAGVKKYSLELTCDDGKMSLKRSETPPPPVPLPAQPMLPAPATLTKNVAAALARGGAWLAQEYADGEYRAELERTLKAQPPPADMTDVTRRHELRNFQLGKAGADGAPVTYDMIRTGESLICTTITVWIDAKTNRPLKREGAIYLLSADGKKPKDVSSTWAEEYKTKLD